MNNSRTDDITMFDFKAFLFSIFTFFISVAIGGSFLFVSTGFLPDNCLIGTDSGCLGIASILPMNIQGILFLTLIAWCFVLAIRTYRNDRDDRIRRQKNIEFLEKNRRTNIK